MGIIDWLFLVVPFVLIAYFSYEFRRDNRIRATREKEQEAALEFAFNEWVTDPSVENRVAMDKIVEEMYGPGVK